MQLRSFQEAADVPPLETDHPCFGCGVRRQAICGVLESDELKEFRASGATMNLAGGETLSFEGDPADNVYNLTSGLLRLSKLLPDGRRQVAGFLHPGEFLGLTMEDDHAFTAETISAAAVCRFPRSRFDAFVESHPHLERRLYALAAHELAASRQQIVLLGRKTAIERLASFLLMLAERSEEGRGGTESQVIRLPMSRTDIADYLGLRIETISRELGQLKAARVVRLVSTHEIEILDRRRLEGIAEG